MKKVSLSILFALLLMQADSFGQTEKLKTLFIYNFSKYIQWPEDVSSGTFEIGVVGETPLVQELQKMADSRKIGSQPIQIKQYASAGDIENDHIVFVSLGSSA